MNAEDKQTAKVIALIVIGTVACIVFVTMPIWLPALGQPQSCADCVAMCRPFAVRACYPGYTLSCYCDAAQPAPLER